MQTIDKTKPVMVTGGSGYLASWIIKILLDDGVNVRATVRDPSKTTSIEHLKQLDRTAQGRLDLYQADLLDQDSFDGPMNGCELVMHTASPFFLSSKNPETELIQPAKQGTKNVLNAANKVDSVKRVVITSSTIAIYGDNRDILSAPSGIFTEEEWNTTSSAQHHPYAYSKTIAEKKAWAMVKEQGRWDLVVINPGWILGPSLSKRTDSTSIDHMIKYGDGTYKIGAPDNWNGVVDVRDVAFAHINAGYTPNAKGRYIVVSEEASLLDIGKILQKHFGNKYPFPKKQVPKFAFWLLAPMHGFTRKWVSRNTGFKVKFDNSKSKRDLKMTYIPFEQTVKDHFQQILNDGLLG